MRLIQPPSFRPSRIGEHSPWLNHSAWYKCLKYCAVGDTASNFNANITLGGVLRVGRTAEDGGKAQFIDFLIEESELVTYPDDILHDLL